MSVTRELDGSSVEPGSVCAVLSGSALVLLLSCSEQAASPAAPWSTQRALGFEVNEPVQRISRGDVSRDLWISERALPVVLSGAAGSLAEFELTRTAAATPGAPSNVKLQFRGDGGSRDFAVTVGEPAPGRNPWYPCRADLSSAGRGHGTLSIFVDGAEVDADSAWQASVPRVYATREEEHGFNVLILSVDTLRADHLGCYGFDRSTSPAIDAFAARSVLFERAISQASWTLPSYASVLTGLYPEVHQVIHRDRLFAPQYASFVESFAAAGYATGGIVSGTFTDAFWGFDQGFDWYDDLGSVTPDDIALVHDPSQGEAMTGAEARVTSPMVTDRAIAWLDQHADRRFLLLAQYFDPHSDLLVHEGVTEKFPPRPNPPPRLRLSGNKPSAADLPEMRSKYEGEIAFTDQHIGRLLDHLDALGLRERTIVVFQADHGEEFDERSRVGHGHQIFNELVHVPLIFAVPGIAARRVQTPVGNLDLGPTLAELCGAPFEVASPGGESLVPLLRRESSARSAPVLSSRYSTMPVKLQDGNMVSLRDIVRIDQEDHSFLYWTRPAAPPKPFLFRWSDDPFQVNNLVEADEETARRLLTAREAMAKALEQQSSALRVQTGDLNEAMIRQLEAMGYVPEKSDQAEEPGESGETSK